MNIISQYPPKFTSIFPTMLLGGARKSRWGHPRHLSNCGLGRSKRKVPYKGRSSLGVFTQAYKQFSTLTIAMLAFDVFFRLFALVEHDTNFPIVFHLRRSARHNFGRTYRHAHIRHCLYQSHLLGGLSGPRRSPRWLHVLLFSLDHALLSRCSHSSVLRLAELGMH